MLQKGNDENLCNLKASADKRRNAFEISSWH